jgi:hypothetical protein
MVVPPTTKAPETPQIKPTVAPPAKPRVPKAIETPAAPVLKSPPAPAPAAKAPPPAGKLVDDFDMDFLAEPAGAPESAPPSLVSPTVSLPAVTEPAASASTIDLAPEIEPVRAESESDPEILLETTASSAIVGSLEEPARFYKPAVAAAPLSQPAATGSNDFIEWIRKHKLYCVIGIILAWVVFAGVQKVLHPIPMSRAYEEEMELRKKIQAAYAERAGLSVDSDGAKGKDQKGAADKAGKSAK